ncbi:hypothetical protein HUW51_15445 [Adhaeribacter swui]|uniref:Uncharacterized protein n=1 Tax=Adhaeribacter swui TaxID=2086471 RepID=A0A7G7GA64_9BACT|nr:hypothetical protein [Adhaeribacter swui]QNF34048.1 hypothetical protein HUW51_15445 [Adhaeribacter swui]
MTKTFTFLLLFVSFSTFAQVKMEWKKDVVLSKSDFKGQAPQNSIAGVQRHYLAANLDFSYAMSNYEFMLTKNFNKFVTASYNPATSWIEEGNKTDLILKMAQLDFDLLELYARKYRQRLYETKNALSANNFFQQAHDELNAEMIKRQADIQALVTDSESNLEEQHDLIKKEVEVLADFCKECKPAKKKK